MKLVRTYSDLIKHSIDANYCPEPEKAWLIWRYWDKVSPRLKEEYEELLKEGRKEFGRMFLEEMKKPSIFERFGITKDDTWNGGYLVVPFPSEIK